jgi:hypothetical protein
MCREKKDGNSFACEHIVAFFLYLDSSLFLSGEMGAKSQVQKSLAGCGPKLLKNR